MAGNHSDAWAFHFGVACVAHQYDMTALEKKAIDKLKAIAESKLGAQEVLAILSTLKDEDYHEFVTEKLADVASNLRDKHFDEIRYLPRFALLEDDKNVMRNCLERLACVDRRVPRFHRQCTKCGRGELVGSRPSPDQRCCGIPYKVQKGWFEEVWVHDGQLQSL